MTQPRCPGQDQRRWRPEDIFCVLCPGCRNEMEFWRDEPVLNCPGCGQEVRNPKVNLACANWCSSAEKCLALKKTSKA